MPESHSYKLKRLTSTTRQQTNTKMVLSNSTPNNQSKHNQMVVDTAAMNNDDAGSWFRWVTAIIGI